MTERGGDPFDLVARGRRADLRDALERDRGLASSIDDRGVPLLHAAAESDDPRMVRLLLDAGAALDTRAPWGQTAFEWAANMGARSTALLLLERGARLDLWTAAALGMRTEVRGFTAGGRVTGGREPWPDADLSGWPADAPFRTGDHLSDAFYIACRNGHLEVAEDLLALGADVDAIGYFGATALHWCAINGHEAVARWLVEAGADTARRDPKFDATPAGWAREGGHHGLADILARAERKP